MEILSFILYVVGVGFCIAGFIGHSTAWVGAALCFFAATMIIIGQQKEKHNKK